MASGNCPGRPGGSQTKGGDFKIGLQDRWFIEDPGPPGQILPASTADSPDENAAPETTRSQPDRAGRGAQQLHLSRPAGRAIPLGLFPARRDSDRVQSRGGTRRQPDRDSGLGQHRPVMIDQVGPNQPAQSSLVVLDRFVRSISPDEAPASPISSFWLSSVIAATALPERQIIVPISCPAAPPSRRTVRSAARHPREQPAVELLWDAHRAIPQTMTIDSPMLGRYI